MFGQYSSQFVGRKTKRDMVAGAERRHRRAWLYPDGKVKTDMTGKNLDRLRSDLDGFMDEWKRKGLA